VNVTTALTLAIELLRLVSDAYARREDDVDIANIGSRSDAALKELKDYLEARDNG